MLQSLVRTDFEVEDLSPGHHSAMEVDKHLHGSRLREESQADLKPHLDDEYILVGSSRYPSYMGTYKKTPLLHDDREVFELGAGSAYLFHRSLDGRAKWAVGPSYQESGGSIVSTSDVWSPGAALGWQEWDEKSKKWESSNTTALGAGADGKIDWHERKAVVRGTKVKLNGAGDLPHFLVGLRFNAVLVVFFLILFAFLQRWYPLVYSCRALDDGETAEFNEHPAPKRWSSTDHCWYRWLQVSFETTSEEVEETSSLDAAMFLHFLTFSMQLMIGIGLPMAFIMIPIYYFKGGGFAKDDHLSWIGLGNVVYHSTQQGSDTTLSEEDLKILPQVQWIYWALAAAVWYVVMFTQCWMLRHQEYFLKRRLAWRLAMPLPQCTTLLVEGIPEEFASDAAFTAFFEEKFGAVTIKHAFVLKRLAHTKLHRHITAYCDNAQRMHEIQFSLDCDPNTARPMIESGEDELEYLEGEQIRISALISEEQRRVKRVANAVDAKNKATLASLDSPARAKTSDGQTMGPSKTMPQGERHGFFHIPTTMTKHLADVVDKLCGDEKLYSTNGFVVFQTRRNAEAAIGLHLSSNHNEWRLSHPPPPNDVIYRNMEITDEWKAAEWMWGQLATCGLYLAFMPLVVGISNFTLWIEEVPLIFQLLEAAGIRRIVKSLSSTIGLTVMMSMLPTFLTNIFTSFFPAKSGTLGQLWVQNYYYWALVLFVLLVTAVGIDLKHTVETFFASPLSFLSLLAVRLPSTTHFYLTYVSFHVVTLSMNLTRYMNLCKFIVYSYSSIPERSYELSEPEDQAYYGIGSRSARCSLILAIGLVFGTICPLMNFVVLIVFALSRAVYGYLIPYAETRKNDLGGLPWVKQLEHMNVSLLVYIVMMTGIIFIQAESRLPAYVVGSCILSWAFGVWKLEKSMQWKPLDTHEYREAATHEGQYQYCQPELEWTPDNGKDPCKMHAFGLDDVRFFNAGLSARSESEASKTEEATTRAVGGRRLGQGLRLCSGRLQLWLHW
jgi:hypothetical protein